MHELRAGRGNRTLPQRLHDLHVRHGDRYLAVCRSNESVSVIDLNFDSLGCTLRRLFLTTLLYEIRASLGVLVSDPFGAIWARVQFFASVRSKLELLPPIERIELGTRPASKLGLASNHPDKAVRRKLVRAFEDVAANHAAARRPRVTNPDRAPHATTFVGVAGVFLFGQLAGQILIDSTEGKCTAAC
jgi:hypothetical protein